MGPCRTPADGILVETSGSEIEREAYVSTSSAGRPAIPPHRPQLSVDELIRAKNAKPIRSLADLEAMSVDLFESDQELDEFLTFTYAERHRDEA
ncbi:hypothetical protein ACWKSP_27070 [Micromonosporaceae bacterium Da 78-11]